MKKINKILIFTLVFTFSLSPVLAESQEKAVQIENRASDDFKSLKMLLDKAEKIDLSEYTEASKSEVLKQIEASKEAIKNNNTSEADFLEGILSNAINSLKVDNIEKLKKLLNEASFVFNKNKDNNLNLFSESALKDLNFRILNSKAFINSNPSDQEDAKKVYEALHAAYKNVVSTDLKSSNQIRNELSILIDDTKIVKAFNYSETSFNQMEESRKEAININNSAESSKKLLLVSYHYLKTTYNGLEKLEIEEKVKLEKLIKEVQKIDLDQYKQESVSNFKEILNKAKKLILEEIEDEDRKVEIVKDYSQMLEDLQMAKDNLEEKAKETTNDNQVNNTASGNSQNQIVNTGIEDNSDLFIGIITVSILAIIGLVYLKFKKDKK